MENCKTKNTAIKDEEIVRISFSTGSLTGNKDNYAIGSGHHNINTDVDNTAYIIDLVSGLFTNVHYVVVSQTSRRGCDGSWAQIIEAVTMANVKVFAEENGS